MHRERKEIIISEIRYWKEHQLLPTVYCDFLLALYTEGEDKDQVMKDEQTKKRMISIVYIFFILLTIIISMALIYNTDIKNMLKSSLLMISFCFSFILHLLMKRKGLHFYRVTKILHLFFVLIITAYFSKIYIGIKFITNLVVLVQLVGWFVIGIRSHFILLWIISLLSIFLTLISLFLI